MVWIYLFYVIAIACPIVGAVWGSLDQWLGRLEGGLMGGLVGLLVGVCVAVVPFFIHLSILESRQPQFTLNKADWVCTAAHEENNLVLVGKVLVPSTSVICDQYTRD